MLGVSGFAVALCFGFSTRSTTISYRKGVLYGKIVDTDGKPVWGATVALRLPSGELISWAKTNEAGEYAIPGDPKIALSLKPSHCRGLLAQCADAVEDVVMVPVKLATSPGPTVRSALVAVASGTPGPIAAQAVASTIPNQATVSQVSQASAGAATNVALLGGTPPPPLQPADKGQADILVVAKGYKDANLVAHAYWLDPPDLKDRNKPVGVQAWLETVELAPKDDKKNALLEKEALTLCNGTAEPTLAPAGSSIDISVKLDPPTDVNHPVRVFARLASRDTVVELMPSDKEKGVYTGSMTLSAKTPPGDTMICIGALRADPVEVKLDPKRPNALRMFVGKVDDMNGSKPYGYDPFVMASENRLDLKVTILPPSP